MPHHQAGDVQKRKVQNRNAFHSRLTCIGMPAAVSAVAHSRMRRSWPGKGLCERTSTALRGLVCPEEQAGMPRLTRCWLLQARPESFATTALAR